MDPGHLLCGTAPPGPQRPERPATPHAGRKARGPEAVRTQDLSGLWLAALRPGAGGPPPLLPPLPPYRRGHQGLRTRRTCPCGDRHGDGALPGHPPPLRKAHTLKGPLRLTQAAEGRFYPNRAGQWTPRSWAKGPGSPAPGHLPGQSLVGRQTLAKDSEALDPGMCLYCRQVQRAGQGLRAVSALTPKRATR